MPTETCEFESPRRLESAAEIAAPASLESPRRVLHVINGEHYSGAERVQDLLALRLGQFGFDVGFACLKPGRFAATRASQRAPLVELNMRGRFDLSPAFRLARLIRREGYSLIHTHTPRAAMIGQLASKLTRVPMMHHIHSPTANDSTRAWQNRANAWIERRSLSNIAGVIAVSQSMARYAQSQGVPASRIHVVPNGVPPRGPLSERSSPRTNWTLGTVALFRPRKGLEVLLDALALLRAEGLPVRLRAVGEFESADYQQQIIQQVERLKLHEALDWVGFTNDVPAELAKMDLFVLPSLFGEGLPMVILEAMACGVPIVATRVEGVPEAVRHGRDGLLADPGSADELARAIERFVRSEVPWLAMRVAAHLRQAESFSDVSMARAVAGVYLQVLLT